MPKITLKTGYYKDGKILPAGEVVEVSAEWFAKNPGAGDLFVEPEVEPAAPNAPPEIADESGAAVPLASVPKTSPAPVKGHGKGHGKR